MASESVPDALISFYATNIYTAGQGLPLEIWLGKVPTTRADLTTVSLPTITLKDNGTVPEYDFEYNPVEEKTSVKLIIRAVTLPAADAIAKRIKYAGAAVSSHAGFDHSFALPFSSGIEIRSVHRTGERRDVEGEHGPGATWVHVVEMDYEIAVQRVGV